jgi:pimeloyl-ACP methyl ester carboxylesterase
MKHARKYILCVVANGLAIIGLTAIAGTLLADESPSSDRTEDRTFKADCDGTDQKYVVVIPQGVEKTDWVSVLIALHGHGSDRWQFVKHSRDECRAVRDVAAAHGMLLISPDYRAKTSWMGPKAEADVVQIIRNLRAEFTVDRVILSGGSMGGTGALTFAARHPRLVDGVVSLNGTADLVNYSRFQDAISASFGGTKSEVPDEYRRRSAVFFPERFTMPIAATTGGLDSTVPPDSTLRLLKSVGTHNPHTLSLHQANGGHQTSYADTTQALEFVIKHTQGLRRQQSPAYERHDDISTLIANDGQSRPIRSRDDWAIRRRQVMAGLEQVMGRLPQWPIQPLDVTSSTETRDGNVVRRKLSYMSDNDRVSAWLLRPANESTTKARRPAVLCLHQTTRRGKDEPVGLTGSPNMHYALELTRRGYVTLSPDYPSLGESDWQLKDHPEFVSGTMKAIRDNMRAVDLLQSLPMVDPERIGVIGHSLGGHNAMFTAAFEPRLKVIVSSCGFTGFQRDDVPSWTGWRYMPRIASIFGNDADRLPFDFPEIIAAFAPRPFMACAAIHDRDFDVTGVRESLAAARPIYELFEHSDHLQAVYPDTPHDFPPAAREQAYRFLDRSLKTE